MTVPPFRTRPQRRVGTRLLGALTAALLAVGLAAAPAAATAPTPTPTPTPDVPTGTTDFTLAPIRNGILTPGETLTASVTIENGTDAATPATAVTLELGTTPLTGRDALTAWLAGDTAGAALVPVGTGTIDPAAPGETRTTAIMVDAAQPELAALTVGVHPLRATYESEDGTVSSTSVVVVPQSDQPVGVGVVVPITAGVQTDGLLTATQLSTLTAPDGALTKQLDGVDQTAAILGVDPAIAVAIRALGVAAPPSAVEWLDRLMTMPNTRFALQFGDADPAVQLEAGLPQPMTPATFTPYLRPVDFPAPATPTATPTPTPTATPGVSTPTLPTRDELVDVRASRGGIFWPAAETVTPAAVGSLGATVDGGDAGITLVPSGLVSPGAARATAGDAGVLVYDADVSRELSDAASIDGSALRAAPLAAASAYLSFAAGEAGGAPVLAALDRGIDRSYIGLQTAISAAAEYPGAVTHSILTLSAAAPRAVTLADATAPADRVAAAIDLVADEGQLARFATILDDPALLTAPERATILQLLAVGWTPLPVEASEAVADHRAETRETLESVRLVPPTAINLFAAGAGLPFTVRNDLPYAVNLVLYATPDDLRLNVRRATEVVATPESNTRVEVPVEARVGNGEVTLDLQLRSPSFVEIGPTESVDVNVRAEWETVGIVVLSVLVGGLILLGVIRTVLKARARRARATGTDAGSAPAGKDDE